MFLEYGIGLQICVNRRITEIMVIKVKMVVVIMIVMIMMMKTVVLVVTV